MDVRSKIVDSLAFVSNFSKKEKEAGKKVVLTSGCFDLLHGDHLEYILAASELGTLIVGINSDVFVKKLKGENRPIRDEDDRAFLLAGFVPVSSVIIFDSDYELIEAVKPDIYVVSKTSHLLVEEDQKRVELLKRFGTEIHDIESRKQDSTTKIIKRAVA